MHHVHKTPVFDLTLLKSGLLATLVLITGLFTASAQIKPAENAHLHYRLIGFQATVTKHASQYLLEIAAGHINSEDSFNNIIVVSQQADKPELIATVPHWGTAYTWRITGIGKKGKQVYKSPLHHFAVGEISYVDTSLYRLRVSQNTGMHSGTLLFSDYNRALFDIDGNALWYLPHAPGLPDTTMPVRDMKLTPQHTITFIANTDAYEIDYEGHLLWQGPNDGKVNGDTSEFYHHEFTRLKNGHYMIAGNEHLRKYLPANFAKDYSSNENVKKEGDRYYVDVDYGTLIEYDSRKNIVWSWKSSAYFADEDLFTAFVFENNRLPGFHYNAFYFNEKDNTIYNSFRNINTIVKIHYPDAKPIARYDGLTGTDTLFTGQHNCRINKAGNLTMFSNNFIMNGRRDELKPSALLVLKEIPGKHDEVSVLSSFNCNFDKQADATAKGSGSAYELQNGDMLVCMGTVNRVFIVKNNHNVVWQAFTERKIENRWLGYSNYRVSSVEGKDNINGMVFVK